LSLQYVCYLFNHAYNNTIKGVPLQFLSGGNVDISSLLRFHFWQKFYYKSVESGFPSEYVEMMGHAVGIFEHCGHALTYIVVNAKTLKVVHLSLLRPATPDNINVCAESLGGESNNVIQSRNDIDKELPDPKHLITLTPPPIVNPDTLIGRTFLMDAQNNGNTF
jgi:hypothetical protein